LGRIEKSIEIKAHPEKVWEMLALDRFDEWQVGHMPTKNIKFKSEMHTPEDKYRVGATAYSSDQPEIEFEITESQENEKITYRVKESNMKMDISAVLETVDEGTKMTYIIDTELKSFLMRVVGKLFAGMGKSEMDKSIEKLKSILEK